MKLVDWPLMGDGLLQLVQRAGDWAGPQPALLARINIPITVLVYNGLNGPLLCGFNVSLNG